MPDSVTPSSPQVSGGEPRDFPPASSIRPNPDYVPGYVVQPATWTYSIDPVTGMSQAYYPGEVSSGGSSGGPFLPLAGGTISPGPLNVGTSAGGGASTIALNSTLPASSGMTNGTLYLNKLQTADNDSPQINSYVDMTHTGADLYANMKLRTMVDGNTPTWCLFNQTFVAANNTATWVVGTYNQQIRSSVNAGGSNGVGLWCEVNEARSTTGLPSSQDGVIIPLELDIFANGADDLGSQTGRQHLSLVLGQHNTAGTPCVVTVGVNFSLMGGANAGYWKSLIAANARSFVALDTRGANMPPSFTDPYAAVRMLAGHIIDFDGTYANSYNVTTPGHWLQYTTTGGNRLRYMRATTEVWSIDDNGATQQTGNLTAANTAGGWSAGNVGRQLLVTGGGNPGIGITDSTGANLFGIWNNAGTLRVASMPAYSNSSSPAGTWAISISQNGNIEFGGALQADGNISFTGTAGLVGTTTNNNAAAGQVGEYLSATGSAVTAVTGVHTPIASVSLTAGDWDIWGSMSFAGAGTITAVAVAVGTVAGNGNADNTFGNGTFWTSATTMSPIQSGTKRLSLAATTTCYVTGLLTFTGGPPNMSGMIQARRRR